MPGMTNGYLKIVDLRKVGFSSTFQMPTAGWVVWGGGSIYAILLAGNTQDHRWWKLLDAKLSTSEFLTSVYFTDANTGLGCWIL